MAEKIILVLGGVRSGKSAYAQQLAQTAGNKVLFIATALVIDEEMARRVTAHKSSRPAEWDTLEAPNNLALALKARPERYHVILLDCVTLLLNGMFHTLEENTREEAFTQKAESIVADLMRAIDSRSEPWILVSNEVGLGIVPDTLSGRVFRDIQGRTNQRLAARADEVYLLVAGIPLKIK